MASSDNYGPNDNGQDGNEDETFGDVDGTPMEVGDEYVDEERLELDEEERLPWLESADYDDENTSSDTGKIVGLILIALLLLALLLGALWWMFNRGPDPELVADGSTIEAPEGKYRERPDDPGGRDFDGTGDVAPAVGEGQTREGRLAQDRETSASRSSGSGETASSDTSGTASATGGVGVQVGAYSTRDSAQRGWNQLRGQTEALSGVKYRIVKGQADIGTVYRLQAVASDTNAANALCRRLKGDGLACQVKR